MSWNIYLPIAGNSVNVFILLGLGGIVGFLSGLFGVGGGFLMTPLLMMVGIPPVVAAASDSNQIARRVSVSIVCALSNGQCGPENGPAASHRRSLWRNSGRSVD